MVREQQLGRLTSCAATLLVGGRPSALGAAGALGAAADRLEPGRCQDPPEHLPVESQPR